MTKWKTTDLPKAIANMKDENCKAFFQSILKGAMEGEAKFGVPAAVTLAQGALESAWGKHESGKHNLFGMKGAGDAGSKDHVTKEFIKGQWITVTAKFASYSSRDMCVHAHSKRFHEKPVYAKALKIWQDTKDPVAFANALTGVYATDPEYGKKLMKVMVSYGLIETVV